ncbi:unnamed protein product [Lampetra fluviatilis]
MKRAGGFASARPSRLKQEFLSGPPTSPSYREVTGDLPLRFSGAAWTTRAASIAAVVWASDTETIPLSGTAGQAVFSKYLFSLWLWILVTCSTPVYNSELGTNNCAERKKNLRGGWYGDPERWAQARAVLPDVTLPVERRAEPRWKLISKLGDENKYTRVFARGG